MSQQSLETFDCVPYYLSTLCLRLICSHKAQQTHPETLGATHNTKQTLSNLDMMLQQGDMRNRSFSTRRFIVLHQIRHLLEPDDSYVQAADLWFLQASTILT